jgi:multicomponent Na+:H+ antiporter subunit D
MNIAALGTAISFAKFIFLPHQRAPQTLEEGSEGQKLQPGFWWAMAILLGGLIGANVFYYEAYTISNIIKPLLTIALGWLAYLVIFKRSIIKLSRTSEQFDHLIGIMAVMLILLFWIVWTRPHISI